jgi:glycosyltransferase involved in cell wall biosynthesis
VNTTLHGELPPEQYRDVLARADVGVGTLALYREGIQEACSLKVREYLAFGLPVVLANTDTDFPSGAEFILQLPNAPEAVSGCVERIEDFIASWRGRRVPRTAITAIDVVKKEQSRLDFFAARVISSRGEMPG